MMRTEAARDKPGMQSCALERQRLAMDMRTPILFAAALLAVGLVLNPARGDSAFQAREVAEGVVSPHVKGKLIWARSLIGSGLNDRR